METTWALHTGPSGLPGLGKEIGEPGRRTPSTAGLSQTLPQPGIRPRQKGIPGERGQGVQICSRRVPVSPGGSQRTETQENTALRRTVGTPAWYSITAALQHANNLRCKGGGRVRTAAETLANSTVHAQHATTALPHFLRPLPPRAAPNHLPEERDSDLPCLLRRTRGSAVGPDRTSYTLSVLLPAHGVRLCRGATSYPLARNSLATALPTE